MTHTKIDENNATLNMTSVILNTNVNDKAVWRQGAAHVMQYGAVFFAYINNKIVMRNELAAKFTDLNWAVKACSVVQEIFGDVA